MTPAGHEPSQLDLYLDGLLPDDQRRAFEEQIAHDPNLRAQLDAQRRLDASLRRTLVAPSPISLPISATPILPPAHPPILTRLRTSPALALAACLLIAFSTWSIYHTYFSNHQVDPVYLGSTPRTMDTIYKVEKDRGFKPMWICRDDKEFATTFWKNLGSALTFRNPPSNVESLGLSYGNTVGLSPKTVYMLFKINGREVIVFIDKKENDHSPKPTTPGLNLYRREAGDFVLYELTPLDKPQAYDKFEPYTMPKEWM